MASENYDQERMAWLTLKLIPGLGNRSMQVLLRHFGSPQAVLRAGAGELKAVRGLRESARQALLGQQPIRSPQREWEALQRADIGLLCCNDPDYPANLAAIPDPPLVLFVKGSIEARDLVAVAVVGSRSASPLGVNFTERLCSDLAQQGVTVVSGLAVGIDSAAHRGALKGRGRTIAVLGCGIDVQYPRANLHLRKEIMESGAVVSEFPLGTPPLAGHFPLRNRIISGLALGVVVVEAADRSGSLITARLALEQGREVFAVPGIASHFRSTGPHRLLKQGAKLVENAEDVLEEIRPLIKPSWSPPPQAAPVGETLSAEEKTLWEALSQEPLHVDELSRCLDWPVSRLMALLLGLELRGVVRQLPGKLFVRC